MIVRFLACGHLLRHNGDLLVGLQTEADLDKVADGGVLDLGVVGSEGKGEDGWFLSGDFPLRDGRFLSSDFVPLFSQNFFALNEDGCPLPGNFVPDDRGEGSRSLVGDIALGHSLQGESRGPRSSDFAVEGRDFLPGGKDEDERLSVGNTLPCRDEACLPEDFIRGTTGVD